MGRIDPLELVATLADPAFATDERERVVAWNAAAQQLLGHAAEAVVGRSCFEILCGRDVFGNRFCDAGCTVTRMTQRRESVRDFELDVSTAGGTSVRVDVRTVSVRSGDQSFMLLHILRPRDARQDILGLMRQLRSALAPEPGRDSGSPPAASRAPLSPREIEVLRLLAQGEKPRRIAARLNISEATSRNHVQNILRKLDAHSQLEAVALALQAALI